MKFTAKIKHGAIKIFDTDGACVATFDCLRTFLAVAGVDSIDDYNAKPATFSMRSPDLQPRQN